MREAVLNSAGLSVQFPNMGEALDALDEVTSGLIFLSTRNHIARHLWMKHQPYEVAVCEDTTLDELFRAYLRRNRNRGRFLLGMATRCPIDNGIEDVDIEDFVENEVEGLPDCTELLWCAVSGTKIAVSLTPSRRWLINPLALKLGRNGTFSKSVDVENVFSLDSARDIIGRLNSLRLTGITPSDLWANRAELFPNLLFGKDVEKQLINLGPDYFVGAVHRMTELDRAVSEWDSKTSPSPRYLSKVTGESKRTMDQYGKERIFRSSLGQNQTYEKHARLNNGGRIHLRELPNESKVEIGYVGKHLRIVSVD